MAEEVVGVIESGESGGSLKEGVTEADVQRVQEDARQAKKVAQQLQQDKKQNNQLANFLSFLLSELTNEKIIKGLYDTFFITIDPKTNTAYFRKSMNDVIVVGLFYPFFKDKADELGVSHFYENLNGAGRKNINDYILFLQDLSDHYHDNIPVDHENFLNLLVEILKEFLPSNMDMDAIGDVDYEYRKLIHQGLLSEE